jgi:hypothetical protein
MSLILTIIAVVVVAAIAFKLASLVFAAVGLGKIVAVAMSLSRNGSIGWAVLHFFCGWLYVIWWCCTGGPENTVSKKIAA